MSNTAVAKRNPIVRILIADDHPRIRNAVRATLEQHTSFEVCAEAGDGAQAIEKVGRLRPDVVVLNVNMPVLGGFEAAREIKAQWPNTAIVILSSHADERFIEEAKKIGARAYIAKSKAADGLVKAIEEAVKGGDFVVMQ